jgi:hypothetical protein
MTLQTLSMIISIIRDLCQIWSTFRKNRQKEVSRLSIADDSQLSEDKSLDNK